MLHELPKLTRRSAIALLLGAILAGCATGGSAPQSSAEQDKLVSDAQSTLNDFIRDPDQTWIQNNLNRAKAVLIAPQIVRAGFIIGGSGGRAVLVARDGRTWSGPAFYDLATASVGFQAGVDVSQAVIVVMTDKGLNSLLSNSFKIGGDASVAAGPVGAGAQSNVTADLISFTRAKGLYGGLNLDGTVVRVNEKWNSAYYNRPGVLPPDILIRRSVHNSHADPLLTAVGGAAR